MMLYIGIDPGLTGAWAILTDTGNFVGVHDFPTMNRNKTDDKQQINVAELGKQMRTELLNRNVRIVMERVTAMPSIPGGGGVRRTMGAASACIFGKTIGHIEACAILLDYPIEFVMPGVWKKDMQLKKDKEAGRARAQQLWPSAPLGFKKHHNRAEALLLAEWYRRKRSELSQDHRFVSPMLRKRGST